MVYTNEALNWNI